MFGVVAAMIIVPVAHANDVGEGKLKSEACAACHGANGISVSDDIPNLAGQKQRYIADQLKAFRAGKRKNGIMQPIASQLSDKDIANLAAFWSSLPGGSGKATSAFVEKVNKTRITFPADYATFEHYRTRNVAGKKQLRKTYANPVAVAAAKAGKPLPSGSTIVIEIYKAKLDDKGNPIKGANGFYEAGALAVYSTMKTVDGWGEDIDPLYRNGDWNYALFTPDKKLKTKGFNQAKCLACHQPFDKSSYLFTLKQLQAYAQKK